MKRIAATLAFLYVLGSPGLGLAATLKPIDADGLNLRAGPGTTHKIVGGLTAGQNATIIGWEGDWFHVRTASGQQAWAAGWVSRATFAAGEAYATVNTDILNVRREPSLTGIVATTVKQGARVHLLEMAGDWWRIGLSSGTVGWVASQYMKIAEIGAPTQPPTQPEEPPTEPQPPPTPPETPDPPIEPEEPPTPPVSLDPVVPVLAPKPGPTLAPVGQKKAVAISGGNVYQGRDPDFFPRYDTVKTGEQLTFLEAAEGWVKVKTPRGITGWIDGSHLKITDGDAAMEIREGAWSATIPTKPGAQPPSTPTQPPVTPPVQPPVTPPAPPTPPTTVRRYVSDPEGLRLRTAASLQGAIIRVLPMGEVLEVLETQSPWLKVRTQNGQIGWVHGDYTLPVTETTSKSSVPAIASAQTTSIQSAAAQTSAAPGTLKVSLTETVPGKYRLILEDSNKSLKAPVAKDATLYISTGTGLTRKVVLPVETNGMRMLTAEADGVRLHLTTMTGWEVAEESEGRLVIDLAPRITGVERVDQTDRTVYRFGVTGYIRPETAIDGAKVLLDLPGAQLDVTFVPEGLRVETSTDGLSARIQTQHNFALKYVDSGFELHLYKPGLAGKTIVLDPGHGGSDPGAGNRSLGLQEANLNLQISLKVQRMLAEKGATVLMTRATDTRPASQAILDADRSDDAGHIDMKYRTRIANELGADLFLSIHHNAGAGGVGGTETYYSTITLNGERSGELARSIQGEMIKALGLRDRGAKPELFYVTRNTDAPAALVEVAFVDASSEAHLLATEAFQTKAAKAIVAGLEAYYAERGAEW